MGTASTVTKCHQIGECNYLGKMQFEIPLNKNYCSIVIYK